MVKPTPQAAATQRKARPPPPPIPEGRITILQWCEKNIGRRVPKLPDVETAVRTAAETSEKIRINSGAAPTAQDLRGMAKEAVTRKLGGLSAASSSGRKSSTAVPGAVASATSAAGVQQQAETPPGTPSSSSPSATSDVRREIDALKEAQAEMLSLQQTPPSATRAAAEPSSVRPTSKTTSSPFRVEVPAAAPSWGFKVSLPAMPTFGTTGRDNVVALTGPASQKGQGPITDGQPEAADEPRSRAKKRTKSRRVDAAVSGATATTAAVDLKAELRAESEKAALLPSPPQRAKQQRQQPPAISGDVAAAPKYVAPAPLYEPAEEGVTSSTSPAKGVAEGVPGVGAGGEEKSGGGLEGVTAAARASLEKLDLRDVSQQVKPFTEKVGSASEAGVAAVLEQGRASLENLQAEADRISAQVASPVADKLSAGSRLSEAFGRGRDGVLKAVGEAGRAVDQGVSAVSSRSAVVVDGLPALKGQTSGLSARLLETSGRALSRATGTAGEISKKMSGGLADLAGRGPDILARVRSISARLFSSDDQDGGLVGGVTAEGAAAAAAVAVAVVAGGAATAIGRSGSGDGGGVAETGAEGIAASGNAGRRGDAVVEQGEERRLQPIGGGEGGNGVAPGEGWRDGEEAEEEEEEGEGEVLQPVGVKLETGATNDGERYGEEAMSASSTLWDMIRGSGTGAGDAVREVSEEDLLERAAELGKELRETAEGLEVLKHEVSSLRESIRESDLEGRARAVGERLASTLEGKTTS
ncbi:expressed unknown protein [Ectocarpus siliculosus]|uniref:Uncharacterized protein n=1 Tax=Ectocarpus siliculosus TaxID=2880 RepID=D8LFG8_ECTSI|nr:expressed unknown protein [Ectocarpus siliculosus]|eukprot:CBN79888.1 expressed unknown protein [Ectocarpus siliculosus]